MELFNVLGEGYKRTSKIIWIALVPIAMDLVSYLLYINIFNLHYSGTDNLFILKLGIIQAPPTVKYILKDFPNVLYSYNSDYGMTGIITELNAFSCLLLLNCILFSSFLTSGYMGCLERAGIKRVTPIDFFILGNRNWFKYFVLSLVYYIPMILGLMGIIPAAFLLFLFFVIFVQYAIVVDDLPIRDSFSNGLRVFINNVILVIKIGICYGLIFSLASIILLPLSRGGILGIIMVIAVVNTLGIGVNKAVLEIYRKLSSKDSNIIRKRDNT